MHRRKLFTLISMTVLMVLVAISVLAACAAPSPSPSASPSPSPSPTTTPPPTEEVYKWKMQHWWGAGEHWLFEMFQQRIEEMSGGRIVIDQLYWDGGLVPWNETHNALRAGTLDIIFDWGEPWIDKMPMGNVEYISSMLSRNIQQSWVLFGGGTNCRCYSLICYPINNR